MQIPITKLNESATLPMFQTEGSAAADISACLDKPLTLEPGGRAIIPTGIAMAIPEGYEVQVRSRSGLSAKHGLSLVNGVGTIDADYRGEIGVIMINLGSEAFTIEHGMRIAQLVLAPVTRFTWHETAELDETERGHGGYGSTGA